MSAKSASGAAFGRAVHTLRLQRGLSQEQVGLRSGLGRSFFGRIERGEVNPTFGTIVKVSTGLDVRAGEVVDLAQRYLGDRG